MTRISFLFHRQGGYVRNRSRWRKLSRLTLLAGVTAGAGLIIWCCLYPDKHDQRLKLAGFLDETGIDPAGLVAMDVGASTGGFTDCLLKRGAARVYAVDVGKGLIDISLRSDPRVKVLEEKNIRYLDPAEIGEAVDLVVIDVSFISLKLVLPIVKKLLKENGEIIALIKPQFEVGKSEVGKGGIVREKEKHEKVISEIKSFAIDLGIKVLNITKSPITGQKGNVEFLIYIVR